MRAATASHTIGTLISALLSMFVSVAAPGRATGAETDKATWDEPCPKERPPVPKNADR